MTGLSSMFPPYSSEAEAIKAFSAMERSQEGQPGAPSATIVCMDPSMDLLAGLNALLTRSGYEVFTTRYVGGAVTLEAKAVITGKFVDEFAQTFEPVKQLAPAQQAVLTTAVPAVGVALLQGDRARLLMMVDQRGTRGQSQQLAGATARLVVDAQRVDGRWKIAEVTPE